MMEILHPNDRRTMHYFGKLYHWELVNGAMTLVPGPVEEGVVAGVDYAPRTMHLWLEYEPTPVTEALGETGIWVEAQITRWPDDHGTGRAVVTSHAGATLLIPEDLVTWDYVRNEALPAPRTAVITGLDEKNPNWRMYLFEIMLNQPQPGTTVDELKWSMFAWDDAEWEQAELLATEVTANLKTMVDLDRPSTFSLRIATESRVWFDDFVAGCPHVWFYSVLRQPGCSFDPFDVSITECPTFTPTGARLP